MIIHSPTVTERVVQSVAASTDTDPLDLPPLYDTIDPDALAVSIHTLNVTMHFQYADQFVTVRSDGTVDVADSSSSTCPMAERALDD